MNNLYIIDPSKPFNGSVLNTMSFVGVNSKNGNNVLQHIYVHYSDMTFAEYNAKHGGTLVAMDWDELFEKYMNPWLKSLQEPFKECTEEQFWNGLECVPPIKWRRDGNRETFFVGERTTHDLYSCYVRIGNKYYNALRSIYTPLDDLYALKDIEP